MIKYSLQNECLENIEAFSDEQMSSDMAVIESVLDIFDKTILMMELSNEPVDIPDVSMFMESAFFQEGDPPQAGDGNGGGGGEVPQPASTEKTQNQNQAPTANQSNTNNNNSPNNNTQNNTMSEADRKAYNKEHWVRMKNKEGKLENIFISIIAFIPRLLGFLIQCGVKFFKKLTNKEADDTVKKGSEAAQSKSTEELNKTLGDDSESSGGGTPAGDDTGGGGTSGSPTSATPEAGGMDTKTKMWNWYDVTPILNAIESIDKVLQSLSTENMNTIGQFGKTLADENEKLTAVLKGRVQMDGDRVVDSKNNLLDKLNGLNASADNAKKSIEEFVNSKRSGTFANRNGNVQDAKGAVTTLKNVIKSLTTIMNAVGTAYGKTYEEASKILKNAGAQDIGEVQNTGDNSQPPVNNGGGENNG